MSHLKKKKKKVILDGQPFCLHQDEYHIKFSPYQYFSKVALMEDGDQNIHLKNLSVHQAANEEEALNLLFLGDTNRMIAEVCLGPLCIS